MAISLKFNWNFSAVVRQREKWYVASCEELDVHSQGPTEQEALNNLVEAMYIFTESCIRRGTLDKVLKHLGFIQGKPPVRSRRSERKTGTLHPLNIPVDLTANPTRAQRESVPCHA